MIDPGDDWRFVVSEGSGGVVWVLRLKGPDECGPGFGGQRPAADRGLGRLNFACADV